MSLGLGLSAPKKEVVTCKSHVFGNSNVKMELTTWLQEAKAWALAETKVE